MAIRRSFCLARHKNTPLAETTGVNRPWPLVSLTLMGSAQILPGLHFQKATLSSLKLKRQAVHPGKGSATRPEPPKSS